MENTSPDLRTGLTSTVIQQSVRSHREMETDDPIVSVLPVHLSNNLAPNLQLHQFPLLNRSLEVPPSASVSGKRIRARLKPTARRLEVHVPVDHRPEVWNAEKSKELGAGRMEDDKEKNQVSGSKLKEGEEPRLSEVRYRSEEIPHVGAYLLGVVRDGELLVYFVKVKLIIVQAYYIYIPLMRLINYDQP